MTATTDELLAELAALRPQAQLRGRLRSRWRAALRAAIRRSGLAQTDVAAWLEVHPITVAKWSSGTNCPLAGEAAWVLRELGWRPKP